jgi:hypothetical protein
MITNYSRKNQVIVIDKHFIRFAIDYQSISNSNRNRLIRIILIMKKHIPSDDFKKKNISDLTLKKKKKISPS